MRKMYIFIALLVVVGAVAVVWLNVGRKSVQPVACTMEAKICPDGSAVGRTGPKCEFAACPKVIPEPVVVSENTGTITGIVTLSPTCPVERIPPEPQCAPKPYQTKIEIFTTDGTEFVRTVQVGADGHFAVTLPLGEYSFQAGGGVVMPRCSPIDVRVQATNSPVSISCDTGIR